MSDIIDYEISCILSPTCDKQLAMGFVVTKAQVQECRLVLEEYACKASMGRMNAWRVLGPLQHLAKHSMGNPHRCPWQRLSRGPWKVVTGVVAAKESGVGFCMIWDQHQRITNSQVLLQQDAQIAGACGQAPGTSGQPQSLPSAVAFPLLFVRWCLHLHSRVCTHARLRSNMSTKRWWSKTWLVSTCWNKARQATNRLMPFLACNVSLSHLLGDSKSSIVLDLMMHVGALVLRNLSRFFPFGQDALIWISWLSSNSTKPRSDDNYQKRLDRKPCIQKAIEAEQIAPLLDLWFLAHVFCLQEWNGENHTGYGRQMRKTHEYYQEVDRLYYTYSRL